MYRQHRDYQSQGEHGRKCHGPAGRQHPLAGQCVDTDEETAGLTSTLHIQLLGDFLIENGHAPIEGVDGARLQSLLAYLLLHGEAPQSRQHLAFLFWPDSSETQARTNLRKPNVTDSDIIGTNPLSLRASLRGCPFFFWVRSTASWHWFVRRNV